MTQLFVVVVVVVNTLINVMFSNLKSVFFCDLNIQKKSQIIIK
jgi:hypothetical protein